MTSNSVRQPDERERARHCLALRLEGRAWHAVAEEVGYTNEASARSAVRRLLDRVEAEDVAEFRSIEGARLDALLLTYWGPAVGGDLKAAEFALKVIAQRAKLLGLNLPEKVELSSPVSNEEFAATAARLMAEIEAGGQPPALESAEADNWTGTPGD